MGASGGILLAWLDASHGVEEEASRVAEMVFEGEGIAGVGQLIGVDAVEEPLGVGPGEVEGVADAHEGGVVLFGEGVDFPVKAAVGVDEGVNGGIKFCFEYLL